MKRRTKFFLYEMLLVFAATVCGIGPVGICFMLAMNLLGWFEGKGRS